jgi:general stress protein CsbA
LKVEAAAIQEAFLVLEKVQVSGQNGYIIVKASYEGRDTVEKKLRAMLIFPAALLVLFALSNDRYSELLYIAYILMSLNLIILGILAFKENKKSPFAFGITAISLLTIFLSLNLLLK